MTAVPIRCVHGGVVEWVLTYTGGEEPVLPDDLDLCDMCSRIAVTMQAGDQLLYRASYRITP